MQRMRRRMRGAEDDRRRRMRGAEDDGRSMKENMVLKEKERAMVGHLWAKYSLTLRLP